MNLDPRHPDHRKTDFGALQSLKADFPKTGTFIDEFPQLSI